MGVVMIEPLIDAERGDAVTIEYHEPRSEAETTFHGSGRVVEKSRDEDGDVVAVTISETKRYTRAHGENDHVDELSHLIFRSGAVEFCAAVAGPEWSYVGEITDVETGCDA